MKNNFFPKAFIQKLNKAAYIVGVSLLMVSMFKID